MAHGSSVNCLALNHSGRTLATGGDDRKVNLWNTGKPNVLVVSLCTNILQCFRRKGCLLLIRCTTVQSVCGAVIGHSLSVEFYWAHVGCGVCCVQ